MLRYMAGDEEDIQYLEAVENLEDGEIKELILSNPRVKQAVYNAMSQIVDSTAMQTARHLMSSSSVADNIKRDMVIGWLAHKRQERELVHKIESGRQDGISFTFNLGTNAEVESVRRTKQAFGISEAADAETVDE